MRGHTVWQNFKCVSHPVQSQLNYRLLCDEAFEVGTVYLTWRYHCIHRNTCGVL